MTDATLRAALTGPLAEWGLDLEDVQVTTAGRRRVVRIVIDRDGGVDLDLAADVSRRLSDLLDEPPLAEDLPGPFVLEVTSPGVDRPLSEPRHWRRARGRLVRVSLADGTVVEGRVADAGEDSALVRSGSVETAVPYAAVRRAVVEVEFSRPDGEDS